MNIESWATQLIMELDEDSFVQHNQPTIFAQEKTTQLPTAIAETYYRSKAFVGSTGINPLIMAADPLLTFTTQLRKISIPPDLISLQSHLCHEIRAFENKIQTSGYHVQITLAARYIICALIDELILHSSWGQEWGPHTLLNYFHREQEETEIDTDRFFIILERSQNDVATHIDLLELIYISLRFGYEGQYRQIKRGHLILANLTDNLYQSIRQQRSEFSKSLLVSLGSSSYFYPRKTLFRHLLPPAWLIGVLTAMTFVISVGSMHVKLKKFSAPLHQLIATFVQDNINTEQSSVSTQ